MQNSINTGTNQIRFLAGRSLPWLVLAILLLYTYAKFFEHTYYGFRWNREDGKVIAIYVPQEGIDPALHEGDLIQQIGPLRLDEFKGNLTQPMFNKVERGEIVLLQVVHASEERTVSWIFPGPNQGEVLDLVYSEGWISFAFWLTGTLALFHLRPKDERRYLMIAFNYLTAIWLTMGSGISQYHIWFAPLILRSIVWLCVPVYLHFHWVFPKPLGKLPSLVVWSSYLLAFVLALAEWFGGLPENLYLSGLLVSLTGSLCLLMVHAFRQVETRRDLRLLLIASVLAFAPAIMIGFISTVDKIPEFAGGALLGLPFIPFAYLYAASRRQLGGSEVRINRIISIYVFLTFLFAVLLIVISLTAIQFSIENNMFVGTSVLLALVFSIAASALTILGFSGFQTFVEHRLLGIPLPQKGLLESYSSQIATYDSTNNLLKFLEKDILPTFLVRQFVFLQLRDNTWSTLMTVQVDKDQIPQMGNSSNLILASENYRSPDIVPPNRIPSWILLVLPLKVGNDLIGVWLFGRRDPDDFYSHADITILKSLTNQTAIALSNIFQTEHLKTVYETNINRYEEEKKRLALDLHDGVLNEMASLLINFDLSTVLPEFVPTYKGLIDKVREVIVAFRPPMLDFGFKYALEDIADKLSERNHKKTDIVANVQAEENWNYPEAVENHLYRIVQEACENALKYARAKSITITGELSSKRIEIKVTDNGIGFKEEVSLRLNEMLANKHFGLAGMHERADLIGAVIEIDSKPGEGTQIRVSWQSNGSI